MSQFTFYDGIDCSSYKTRNSGETSATRYFPADLLFEQNLSQGRKFYHNEWTIVSLDIVLGLIGGFVGLVWSSLDLSLGSYESFKFKEALISEAYSTTDCSRMQQDGQPDNAADAKDDLTKSL